MSDRTVKVTGKGALSVKPDQIRLRLDLTGSMPSYEDTVRISSEQVEALKDIFEGLGFARSDLKTVHFDIDTNYESYQTPDKAWKKRFVGYEFTHNLKIEFDADNELLGKVLYALSKSQIRPEFRIEYTVKDIEASKNELLAKAVADSRAKAEVLTKAAGVTLGEIQTIDYSWGEVDFSIAPMEKKMMLAESAPSYGSYNMDIEPEDIDVTDTVTVVWEIY